MLWVRESETVIGGFTKQHNEISIHYNYPNKIIVFKEREIFCKKHVARMREVIQWF